MILQWYHWAILGTALIASELLVPAFVLVWFGLGALAVALLLALSPTLGLIPQMLGWIAVSVALVALWFQLFKPNLHKTLTGRASAEAVGEVGLLVTEVGPFHKGTARFQRPIIGSDVWECIADEVIAPGTRIKIVSVEGSMLKIQREKNL